MSVGHTLIRIKRRGSTVIKETESDSGSKRKAPPARRVSADRVELSSAAPRQRRRGVVIDATVSAGRKAFFEPPLSQATMVFYRGMATLINAGVPISRALLLLASQCERYDMRVALQRVLADLDSGRSLSQGLRAHPRVFSPMHAALISLGEQTGALNLILGRIAGAVERDHQVGNRVKSSLVYPLGIALSCIVFVVLIPALTFPSLMGFFDGLQAPLPPLSRAMFTLLKTLGSAPFLVSLTVAGFLVPRMASRLLRQPVWRRRADRLLDRVPGLAAVRQAASTAEVSRSLGLMYAAGVPILKALDLTSESSTGRLAEALQQAKSDVTDGIPLHKALRDTGFFPPAFYHLVAAGEESGKVAPMLENAAQFADETVDQVVGVALAALQPVILGIIGLWVGALVIALMAPMVSIANSL